MFCTSCGTELADDSLFCMKCGAKQPTATPKDEASEAPTETTAPNAGDANDDAAPSTGLATDEAAPEEGTLQTAPIAAAAGAAAATTGAAQPPTVPQAQPIQFAVEQPMQTAQMPNEPIAQPTPSMPPAGAAPAQKSKAPIVIAAAAAVIAIAAIVLLVYFIGQRSDNPIIDTGKGGPSTDVARELPKDYDGIMAKVDEVKAGTMKLVSTDVSNYPDVKLYFTYEDNSGNPIELSSPTAGVKESIAGGEEIERTIKSIEKLEGNQGLNIDIVADKSGSMSSDLPSMQRIMTDFVNSLDYGSGDTAEIITFDSYIMYMCTYTNDVSRLREGIQNMSAYGETALYDALYTGIDRAAGRTGARCVIGFTDGADNKSTHTYQQVIDRALSQEVPVYLIGTSGAETKLLKDLCTQTGGKFWSINSIGDMKSVLDEIYRYQKDMYCIEYTSDGSADAYATRAISCGITDGKYGNKVERQSFTPVKTRGVEKHESRYEIISGDVSWTEANDLCLQKGGHLATITSQDEMNLLEDLADDSGLRYLWIGGYTSVNSGKAYGHWITGEPFNYSAWYDGEPSRNDKDGTPEFYLMMWDVKDDGNWTWNDQRNDVVRDSGLSYFEGKVGYIIEYED